MSKHSCRGSRRGIGITGLTLTERLRLRRLALFPLAIWPFALLCLASFAIAAPGEKNPRGKAEHVVLVAWDGMRPDFVSEANTPNLWKLARSGVTFRNHHSIYPSLTSVNATALATGVNPSRSGMLANWAFRPDLGTAKLARMDAPETIRRGDEISGGRYLAAPTIAELVQARGGRTAVAGTKTAPLLHSRKAVTVKNAAAKSVTLFNGETLPAGAVENVVKLIGPFPHGDEIPNKAQDGWTMRALTEVLWKEGVPEYSLLWLSDPDRSQHATAPGTEAALAGIRSADTNLGLLLRGLDQKNVREKTDILLVSDHGFSTIARAIDVAAWLRKHHFNLASDKDLILARGEVRIAGNGGSNLYYVGERDPETTARLVEMLQQTDFAGVIFSREPREGTFPLTQVHIDTPSGPDVVMAFRWNGGRNASGTAGMIDSNAPAGENKGTHGTLSPFDVHNTFIAAGPDFRRGTATELPTANTDVAATILHILGITPPEPLDGRVVTEAMTSGESDAPAVEPGTMEASRALSGGVWHQYLRTSKVSSSIYFDEGNGEFRPKAD